MKKVIKLTESELKNVINESVTRILNEMRWDRSGSVPRDGMTGGSWGTKRVYGTYWVDVDELIEYIDDETYTDELYDKLESIREELYFDVNADYEFDDSVGQPEGYYNIKVDITPCLKAIGNMSLFRGDEIRELKQALQTIANRVKHENGEDVDWS